MINKQSYQSNIQNNFRNLSAYKYSIPEKKNSEDINNNALAEVALGNKEKINNYLLKEHIDLDQRNEVGESVLHSIIKNSNLSSFEKLDQVKFALENGAPINSHDNNNVTPLHLACKFQEEKIVKLLIEKGADINSLDSSNKSILHYAVTGSATECPKYTNNIVKPLIPQKPNKLQIKNEDLKNLNTHINRISLRDPKINKFFEHILTMLTDPQLSDMYDNDDNFKKEQTGYLKEINKINSDFNISQDEKNKKIFDAVVSFRNSLYKFYNDQLSQSLQKIKSIEPNIKDGWGPDNQPMNKILPSKEFDDIYFEKINMTDKEYTNSFDKLYYSFLDLDKNVDSLSKINEDLFETIYDLDSYLLNITAMYYYDNTKPGNTDTDYTTYDNFKKSRREVNDILITLKSTRFIIPFIEDELTYDFTDSKITDNKYNNVYKIVANSNSILTQLYNDFEKEITENKKVTITGENRVYDPSYFKNQIIETLFVRNLNNNKKVLKFLKKDMSDPDKKKLTDVLGDEVLVPDKINFKPNLSYPRSNVNNKQNTDLFKQLVENDPLNLEESEKFFIKKTNVFVGFIKKQKEEIKMNINYIMKNKKMLNTDVLYFQILPDIMMNILNIIYLMIYVRNEKNTIIMTLEKLDLYFKEIDKNLDKRFDSQRLYHTPPPPSSTLPPKSDPDKILKKSHRWIFEQVFSHLQSSKDNFNNLDKYISDIYTKCKTTIESMNGIIQSINLKSAKIVLEKYYNNYTGPSNDTITIDQNIFFSPLNMLNPIPEKFLKFSELIVDDISQNQINRKKIIDMFIPKLDKNNQALYITLPYVGPRVNTNPVPSYLISDDIDIDTETFPSLAQIGKETTQYNISRKIPPSIKPFFDTHVSLLKYHIIKLLVEHTNDTINDNTKDPQLYDLIKKLYEKMNRNDPHINEDNSILFITIAKLIDDAVINFIKEVLTKHVNMLVQNLYNSNTLTVFLKKYPTDIDRGFMFDTNDTIKDILKLYETRISEGMQNTVALSIVDLNEEKLLDDTVHKIKSFVFGQNVDQNEYCYKIDHKIIKLLLSSGANINIKDNMGRTPIYYAVSMMNKDVVELFKSGSLKKLKDKFGKTPIQYINEKYIDMLTTMENKNAICNDVTKKLMQEFLKKGNFGNNLPKYSKMLLKMTLYLINHQLYIFGKTYPIGWTNKLNNDLFNMLSLQESTVLPLINNQNKIIKLGNNNAINSKIKELNKKKNNIQQKINEINESTKSIDRDIVNKIDYDMKNSNDLFVSQLENEITTIKNTIATLEKNKNVFDGPIKTNKLTKNVDGIYDSVFYDVINHTKVYSNKTDLTTYPTLWKELLDNEINDNYTQLFEKLISFQKNETNLETNVGTINIYYKNVLSKFASNYIELPREYNNETNFAMKIIIDIITHIVKRVIIVNLYNTIVKIIIKYIESIEPYSGSNGQTPEMYSREILQKTKFLINGRGKVVGGIPDTTPESPLMKYLFDEMPIKLVKCITKIYVDEYDEDMSVTIMSLFEKINKLLRLSVDVQIADDSSLTSNLDEFVYPYFKEYFQLFISGMFNMAENYIKFIKYNSEMIEIINILH